MFLHFVQPKKYQRESASFQRIKASDMEQVFRDKFSSAMEKLYALFSVFVWAFAIALTLSTSAGN